MHWPCPMKLSCRFYLVYCILSFLVFRSMLGLWGTSWRKTIQSFITQICCEKKYHIFPPQAFERSPVSIWLFMHIIQLLGWSPRIITSWKCHYALLTKYNLNISKTIPHYYNTQIDKLVFAEVWCFDLYCNDKYWPGRPVDPKNERTCTYNVTLLLDVKLLVK